MACQAFTAVGASRFLGRLAGVVLRESCTDRLPNSGVGCNRVIDNTQLCPARHGRTKELQFGGGRTNLRPTDYENTRGTCGVLKVFYFIRFFRGLVADRKFADRVLWPAYNLNIAPPQASTDGLFQQTRLFATTISRMTGMRSWTARPQRLGSWSESSRSLTRCKPQKAGPAGVRGHNNVGA